MKRLTDLHKKRIGESVSKAKVGVPLSLEHKETLRGSHTDRKRETCPHCDRDYAVNVFKRHEAKCKLIMGEKE